MKAARAVLPNPPKVVIIESTELFQLGHQFEHVDFADLLALRQHLGYEIKISEVSWLELLRHRRKQLLDCIAKIRELRASIEKFEQPTEELNTVEARLADYEKNLDSSYEKKISGLGIKLIPLPKVTLADLLKMSINNDAPFQETGEKGFRDALIMFSILEAMADHPELNTLLICADKLLTKGISVQQARFWIFRGMSITHSEVKPIICSEANRSRVPRHADQSFRGQADQKFVAVGMI